MSLNAQFRISVMASCKCVCCYQVVEPIEEDGEEGEGAPDDPDAEHKMIQGVLESLLQDDEDADQPAQVSLSQQDRACVLSLKPASLVEMSFIVHGKDKTHLAPHYSNKDSAI